MPLKVYDAEDAIPQDEREDYAEDGGKWRHKVEIEAAAEKRKRAQLLTEKREAERLRKEAEDKLADAERVAEAARKGISETELQKMRDEEAKARKPIEDERDALKAENRKLKLTDRVKALALTAGIMPDRIGQAMKILDGRTDLGDKDGIVVKDEDGNVTTETIEDFLGKTFKKESPWFYAGSGASGSGASGSNGSGGGTTTDATQAQVLERKRAAMPGAL
jgi:flagellar biosynthesis GTPase FlhF